MSKHLDDILFILGAVLVTTGAGLIYIPAAFIIGGLFCIAFGVLYSRYLAFTAARVEHQEASE